MTDYLAWKCGLLGDVVALVGGNGFPEKFQGGSHGDIPFFKVSDMSLPGNERFLTRANNYVGRELAASQGWSLVPPGSVAFAKVGAALLLNRRRVTTTDSLVDNNMMAAVPNVAIHPAWLYWWLQTVDFGVFVQPGALPSVNQEHLRSLRVLLPSYSEQALIAAVLDTVDEAIAKMEAVIAKLRQVRAGLLHDLLTRGLDEHGQLRDPLAHPEQFQDSPLGRIPREWEVLSLEALLACVPNALRSGPFGSALLKQELKPSGIPLLGIDNVHVERFVASYSRFVNRDKFEELRRYAVRPLDVMITIMGTVGRCCVAPDTVGSALSSKHVWTITFDSDRYSPYLACWQMNHAPWVLRQLRRDEQGGVMTAIRSETLRGLLLPVPQPHEIRAIEAALQESSRRIAAEEALLPKLVSLKSGLMADLLTGRVRVPESLSVMENQS